MSNKFLVVKKYIDQMDYYGLLACGAPSDEFDIETKEISARISDDHSVQDIAVIIASVFNEYFDEHDDATDFYLLQNRSKMNYQNNFVHLIAFLPHLRTVMLLFRRKETAFV